MTSLNMTIEIPADRRLTIDLPGDWPPGPAEITLTISPTRLENQLKPLSELFGSLKESRTFAGDSTALVRGLRDEW